MRVSNLTARWVAGCKVAAGKPADRGWAGGVLTFSHRDLQLLQLAALASRSSVCVHWPHVHCLLHHSLTHSFSLSRCIVGQYHKIATKHKRVDIDINVKMQILKEVDSNAKQKDIACKFGINVSTVSKLVKNREKIKKIFSLIDDFCRM